MSLSLGSVDPLPRLVRFLSALPHLEHVPGQQLAGVDLRYGNGFSVRWRERVPAATDAGDSEVIMARHDG